MLCYSAKIRAPPVSHLLTYMYVYGYSIINSSKTFCFPFSCFDTASPIVHVTQIMHIPADTFL